MRCDKTSEIVAWLKSEVAEEDREPLRIHFEGCPACSENLARYDRLLKAVGRMEDPVEPSSGFAWKVRQAFAADHPEFVKKAQGELPSMTLWQIIRAQFEYVPAWAFSATAHLAVLAIGALIFLAPRSPEEELKEASIRSHPKAPGGGPDFRRPGISKPVGIVADFSAEGAPVWSSDHGPKIESGTAPETEFLPVKKETDPFKEKYQPHRWVERLKMDRRVLAYLAPRTDRALRKKLQKEWGGNGVESAVNHALRWLARVQEKDGSWSTAKHGGKEEYEIGLTGLSLLAFLADGNTSRSGGHRQTVKRGLDFLLRNQKSNGLVGSDRGHYMYSHAIAAIALFEAWLMTGDEDLQASASSAVAFTAAAQNESGGWGYRYREETSDTSVAGWQILLLRLAFAAGDRSVIPALTLAHDRIEKSTNPEGKVGYREAGKFPHGYHALTSVGMLSYLFTTHSPDRDRFERQAALLRDREPVPLAGGGFDNDLYFAYFGSMALLQAGEEKKWIAWYEPLKRRLLEGQLSGGNWPISFDKWAGHGGRIYTTAMSALVLEVTWRYPRLLD